MYNILEKYTNREHYILITLCGLMLLAISKDMIHAFIKDYNFYLSESMLFGMFWLLFVPFILVNKKLLSRNNNQLTYLVFPFIFSLLHVFIFSLLVFSVSWVFFNHTFGIAEVFFETFADNSLSCLLIYGTLAFIIPKVEKTPFIDSKCTGKIRVNHHNKIVLLAYEDILYVKTERPYVVLVTQNSKYLYNSSLRKFIKNNKTNSFVQIHKSTIVNMDYVSSYKSRKNGDYDIFMLNGDTLRLSRNFNTSFKLFSKASA